MNDKAQLEQTLWSAADEMRGSMEPGEYKHIALGLIFLKYISDKFEATYQAFKADSDIDEEDYDEYLAEGVFWVPEKARWTYLAERARQSDIGVKIDEAMDAIEAHNDSLEGTLPKRYGRPEVSALMLGNLIDLFTNKLDFSGTNGKDTLGHVYEYFLGKFAKAEGKAGGEFFTPPSMVNILVKAINPTRGRLYEPCHGTGGFIVSSEELIESRRGQIGDIAVYGQERVNTTWKLAKMNLAIHGIEAHLAWNENGTLLQDAFPDERFDYILANPPFNQDSWGQQFLTDDHRWEFGLPPKGSANFAWLQHIVHHLAENGTAGVVMANGTSTANDGGQGEIRKRMVQGQVVDCIIQLPNQMFIGTQIPACLWIFSKSRAGAEVDGQTVRDRRDEVLFIDARHMGHLQDHTFKVFSEAEVDRITSTYHSWREKGCEFDDEPGFCKAASLEEIEKHAFVLTPGRYVGAAAVEDDGVPFEEKMDDLVAQLSEQMVKSRELDERIRKNMEVLGYEV